MNLRPINGTDNKVIVTVHPPKEQTASGIFIPDSAKEKPQIGTVEAVSNDIADQVATVKAGDVVLFGKYAGTEHDYQGQKLLFLRENEIFAIIPPTETQEQHA